MHIIYIHASEMPHNSLRLILTIYIYLYMKDIHVHLKCKVRPMLCRQLCEVTLPLNMRENHEVLLAYVSVQNVCMYVCMRLCFRIYQVLCVCMNICMYIHISRNFCTTFWKYKISSCSQSGFPLQKSHYELRCMQSGDDRPYIHSPLTHRVS